MINKPAGMTSHDVVAIVRKKLDTPKVGHTGTLDPLTTGVLVVCVGKALKIAEFLMGSSKSYRAVATLGAKSDTGDADGEITPVIERALPFSKGFLEAEMKKLEGTQKQTPPKYSAIKIKGKPAYKRARDGEDFEVPEREVDIYGAHFIRFEWPELEFKVKCSAGTYIRSLIEKLGENLNCGAYMSALKRTRSGGFTLKDSIEIDDVSEKEIIPTMRAIENLKRVRVTPAEIEKIAHGQAIPTIERYMKDPGPIVLFDGHEIVAVAEYDNENFLLKPNKVLINQE